MAPGDCAVTSVAKIICLYFLYVSAACQKIPLTGEFGVLDLAIAHWFENEGVAYVFYSLSEREARLLNPVFSLSLKMKSQVSGGEETLQLVLDGSQAVHEHRLIKCGPDKLCGSYSVRSSKPLSSGTLKFQYDPMSELGLLKDLSVQNHFASDRSESFSTQLFGVFDQTNEHLQVRAVPNFGVPGSEAVPLYGMERKYRIFGAQLENISLSDYIAAKTTTGSPLAFPASYCKVGARGPTVPEFILEKSSAWSQQSFTPTNPATGACFTVEYLGKDGEPLLKQAVAAAGLRNPLVRDATSFSLTNPLRETLQIPLVIKICDDDPARGSMVDEDFFKYQRYVLGYPDFPQDVCFRIGRSEEFREQLENVLSSKLSSLKSQPNPDNRDYMFVVVLHDKFTLEFSDIQSKIAESLSKISALEADFVSPRLIGGIVYASTVNFVPTVDQQKYLVWCPQNLLDQVLTGPTAALGKQNCTISPLLSLDLRIINFVAPLGPLPSLDYYTEYVKRYGDSGLARSPQLKMYSVPQTNLTIVEEERRITYFDSQRYVIGQGEKARVCRNRLVPGITDMVIKPFDQDLSIEGISLFNINALWLSETGAGEYRIGISWRYGFWGGISYKGALNGKVVSVIPYTRSFSAYEELGDSKWSTETIPLGQAIQHCAAYCGHPFFDEWGQYQVGAAWDDVLRSDCTTPKISRWNDNEVGT